MVPFPVKDPLPAELVCGASLGRRMHPDDLAVMEQTVTWKLEPQFPRMGRSAWLQLVHPFQASSGKGNQEIRSLKVKGVGLRDHRGVTMGPGNGTYRRPDAHLGFDENGGFCELRSAPAPMGGLTLNRALVEYATANELCAAGPISEVPLFLYRYTAIAGFRDDLGSVSDLAVMVAGLPTESPARADNLVHYARQSCSVQATLRDWAKDHTGEEQFDWAEAQLTLWSGYGKRLQEFHAGGFYRHNSNPCNIGLGPHGVFLVDLDSTRHLLECSPHLRALQVLRDVAGAIFHIIDSTIRSAEMRSVESAMSFVDATVGAFLEKYFPDVSRRTFEQVLAIVDVMTSELWHTWSEGLRRAVNLADSPDREYRDYMAERHSHRSRGIDGPALFSRLMPGLTEPYLHSRIAYQGGPLSAYDVVKAAEMFLLRREVNATSP